MPIYRSKMGHQVWLDETSQACLAMDYLITPEFEQLIGPRRLSEFNAQPGTVYGLNAEFRIAYLNPAWFSFARENGDEHFDEVHWSLGKNIFDAIPAALTPYYRSVFDTALNQNKASIKPILSEYECSSPEHYRIFSMHLYPVGNKGIVVLHALRVEETQILPPGDITAQVKEHYIDDNGVVHQCANCRRIMNLTCKSRWDYIPKWIKAPYEKISHAVCPACLQHYYLAPMSAAEPG